MKGNGENHGKRKNCGLDGASDIRCAAYDADADDDVVVATLLWLAKRPVHPSRHNSGSRYACFGYRQNWYAQARRDRAGDVVGSSSSPSAAGYTRCIQLHMQRLR